MVMLKKIKLFRKILMLNPLNRPLLNIQSGFVIQKIVTGYVNLLIHNIMSFPRKRESPRHSSISVIASEAKQSRIEIAEPVLNAVKDLPSPPRNDVIVILSEISL